MLRRVRWLLVAAMVAVTGVVGWVYWRERAARERAREAPPPPLPQNTAAVASQWEYEIKSGAQSRILVRAQRFEQIKEPAEIRLEGLEMEIRHLDGPRYDLVKSPRGTFRQKEGFLTAEGEVEITLGLTREPGAEPGRVMRIRTSAVSMDVQSNRAWTDRPAQFDYGAARGQCVGASFDPGTREIVMEGGAEMEWLAGAGRSPLRVQAAKVIYKEATADVILAAPSRLERGGFELRGQDAFVKLGDEGQLLHVQTSRAFGSNRMPGRRLDYEAGELMVFFGDRAEARKIEATRGARLVSTGPSGLVEITADRLDLEFEAAQEGSVLRHALAMGNGKVTHRPVARKERALQGMRVLESEVIHLAMREGREEMERAWTEAPGRIELRPAKAEDPWREVKGERFTFDYGKENVLERFRATKAETRTVRRGKDGKHQETRTRSEDLLARFDPNSGELAEVEQWNRFEYEQGQRRASAGRARYEARTERVELTGSARVWDTLGVTAAPEIEMDQKQDVMTAGGGVSALLQQQGGRGGLIEAGEPLRATAERMRVEEGNNRILFEGNAVLWQGEMRLRAQRVKILRKEERLEAEQEVVAEIPDARGGATGARAQTVSVVRAPSMVYEGKERRVRFSGGVRLLRPGMTVESRHLLGFFSEEAAGGKTGTRLERLEAERDVVILEEARGRKRTGRGERAEYFPEEERIVLSGGNPSVEDAIRGITRGAVITWYGRQDRMIVDNEGRGPAVSRVKQKGS